MCSKDTTVELAPGFVQKLLCPDCRLKLETKTIKGLQTKIYNLRPREGKSAPESNPILTEAVWFRKQREVAKSLGLEQAAKFFTGCEICGDPVIPTTTRASRPKQGKRLRLNLCELHFREHVRQKILTRVRKFRAKKVTA